MYLPMKVVWPLELDKLIHRHIVYPWPPIPGSTSANGTELYHAVLPVVLASTDGAQWQLDAHLTLLVNEHFQSFPLYQSPLKVLSNIYHFYVQIGRPVILLVALKFLVLTHMADGAVIPVSDQNVRSIIRGTLHSVDSSLAACPTPCFVRGQLGAEVPVLASKLLRNLLTRLERIALSRQCNQWPVVLASMAVLLMAMESIHYKAAKEEYHAHMKDRKNIDPMPAMRRNFSTTSNISTSSTSSSSFSTTGLSTPHSSVVDINDGAINAILRFYRNCFGGCHEKLALPAQPVHPAPLVPTISSFHSLRPTHHQHTYSFGDLVQGAAHAPAPIALSAASAPQARVDDSATAEASFVSGVRSALADAREYLGERKTEKGTDMTGFFDRLLARLFV
ncbi:hypothetical protein EJ05DRAFT_55115 [Pseudovirgaria hyperparasitica]|uniref:Uncharacterized protein n=1 Tax=Pseudovirgaria hyperparasitica TaxID=470096 RepID=A0A6A6W3D0_9PEZI|nr:uncharacterized protein EJ05DRAFT_55115 [Pseudovirgaria hyperparasitica]KAF2757075.1 hypothetical protein EJ05DRAFT_55115 [Pseudovirgaria hyperparasitica]